MKKPNGNEERLDNAAINAPTFESRSQTVEALSQEVAALQAQLEDQMDTSVTFQQRNGELESQVLQNKKSLLQTTRTVQQLQSALAGKDQEIALLKARQADKPDLMASTAVRPLKPAADQPSADAKAA